MTLFTKEALSYAIAIARRKCLFPVTLRSTLKLIYPIVAFGIA